MAMAEVPALVSLLTSVFINSSSLIQDRLAFLICIIDQVLKYNSLLHHGVPTPSESCSKSLSRAFRSDTLCPLCQTPQVPKKGKGRNSIRVSAGYL